MNTMQQKRLKELDKALTSLLQEIFDFVLFVNQRYLTRQPAPASGWQPNFFEEVTGTWAGKPLFREAQLDYEQREEFR